MRLGKLLGLCLLVSGCQTTGTSTTGATPSAAGAASSTSSSAAAAVVDTTAAAAGATATTPAGTASENDTDASTAVIVDATATLATNPTLNITRPTLAGHLQNTLLTEVSGMAASLRQHNLLWVINDSGNVATLYAISPDGQTQGIWPVAAGNQDWEDLAAVRWNDEAYLLIGDIGDNLRIRHEYAVYIVPEPIVDSVSTSQPASPLQPTALRFRYEDGAHNAEAMAVIGDAIYILTKEPVGISGTVPSGLYRLTLTLDSGDSLQVAKRIGTLTTRRPGIEARLAAALAGVDLSHATALAFNPDATAAFVLTYRHVLRFDRSADESWTDAFSRKAVRMHTHSLAQAEALSVAMDGTVWFTSENAGAPLWVLPAVDK